MKKNQIPTEFKNLWLIKKLYDSANESTDPKLRRNVVAFAKQYIKDFYLLDKIDDVYFKNLI